MYFARLGYSCIEQDVKEDSGDLAVSPWLEEVFGGGEICGGYRGNSWQMLQVGRRTLVTVRADFDRGLMKNPKSPREIRVRFQGGGLPSRVTAEAWDWRRDKTIKVLVRARRPGKVKVWVDIAGQPTANKMSLRVVPMPSGCR